MTRDAAIPVLHRLVGVPTTRTIRGIPTEVLLGVEEGFPTECALALDNTAQIYKAFLTRRITTLAAERMREVCDALQITLAC
jgi:mRNA interferase MazF